MVATQRQPIPVIRPLAALSRVLDALLLLPPGAATVSLYERDFPGAEAEIIALAQANGLDVDYSKESKTRYVSRDHRVMAAIRVETP